MELYAHLIMYYFITATLSAQTAGAYAAASFFLPPVLELLQGYVFTLCCHIFLHLSCSNKDIFVLIASAYQVAWRNCPSASISL